MLSPGKFHEAVPKRYDHNFRWREFVLAQAKHNRELQRALREICRQDILFYIDTFVYQFNPDNLEHEVEPFITYDFQEHAILGADVDGEHRWGILECVEEQRDARWPKSRKMGASWIAMMTSDWLCKFHTHKSVGVLSRDEDSVDQSGDPNSLFWKIDFLNEHQPDWLKGRITKKKMRFIYEDTGSIIIGEANTPSAFVSGRATLLIIDEFGQFKNGAETHDMSSSVAFCRIYIFTHKEQSGMAYDLCFDVKYKHMREIKTHWSLHPLYKRGLYRYNEDTNQPEIIDKLFDFNSICAHGISKKATCKECAIDGVKEFDFVMEAKPVGGPYPGLRSPWYDKECERRSERDVQMNLDIDPAGASDKFFDAYRVKLLKNEPTTRGPIWRGKLEYDGKKGLPLELVEDPTGPLSLWVLPKSPKQMPKIRAGAFADISAGSGASPSCLSMMNAITGEKFLEYANALIFANEFAEFCTAMCRMIICDGVHPLLGWEIQGGGAFGRRVRELGYGPVYIRADEDALGKPRDNKGRPGINTNDANAMLAMMGDYRDALYDRRCVNPSEFALDETLKFVYSNRGVEYRGKKKPKKTGDEGSMATIHHGDIVMADAGAWKMVKEIGLVMSREAEPPPNDWIDPRCLAGRIKLFENQQEAELVWR